MGRRTSGKMVVDEPKSTTSGSQHESQQGFEKFITSDPSSVEYVSLLQQYTDEAAIYEAEVEREELCEARMTKAWGLVILGLYVTLGTITFGFWEEWSFVNSLYFVIVTITTVGYGDITPATSVGQAFTIIFMTFGLVCFSLSLGFMAAGRLDHEADAVGMEARIGDASQISASETECKDLCCKILWNSVILIIVPCIGAGFFIWVEDWDVVQALYMSFTTCTTIGYGDFSPQNKSGRVFGIIWIFIGIVIFGSSLTSMGQLTLTQRIRKLQRRRLLRPLSGKMFANFAGRDRTLTCDEFTVVKLLAQGKICEEDLERCASEYRRIDHSKKGYIELEDVRAHFHENVCLLKPQHTLQGKLDNEPHIDVGVCVPCQVVSPPS